MLATEIIRKPLVTEKTAWASSAHNRYAFEVAPGARKPDVRRAVEELYGVRVVEVAIQNRKGVTRRNRNGAWKTRAVKRAIVKVHAEDRIELF